MISRILSIDAQRLHGPFGIAEAQGGISEKDITLLRQATAGLRPAVDIAQAQTFASCEAEQVIINALGKALVLGTISHPRSGEHGNHSAILVEEGIFAQRSTLVVVVAAEFTGARDHERIHRGVAPRVDVFPLQDLLFRELHLATVSYVVEHQRALLHSAVDGGIHLWTNLAARSADLGIGIQINFVNHNGFAAHVLQIFCQALRVIHKAAFIIRKEGDGVAPRIHGGGIFGHIPLNLVNHLRGLFGSLHRETAHADVGYGMGYVALVLIHKPEIIIGDVGFLGVQRTHRLVRRHEIHNAVAVLIVE